MMTQYEARLARYERACWWLEHEVDLVPLKPRSKELQPGYGARKAHIIDTVFARKWFLNTDANLGVVLGGLTRLAVADWDNMQGYESWHATTGAMTETLVEQTARGYHWFFMSADLTSTVENDCELKTNGICMVSPSVHPSGVVYHILSDVPIITLNGEQVRTIFPFLSERWRSASPVSTEVALGEGKDQSPNGGVIARIKITRSIVDEMSAAGIKLGAGGKMTLVGLCPFHEDHSPSLWVNPQSGLWGCNRPGCPAAGIHDVINFRALRRGISNNAAIKQLADEFLVASTCG